MPAARFATSSPRRRCCRSGPCATTRRRPITQSGGSLHLPVTTGDINEASTGPVSFAGQDLPAGNWVATTKLTLAHTSHWQWAGLVVHKSDNEYNKVGFVRGPERRGQPVRGVPVRDQRHAHHAGRPGTAGGLPDDDPPPPDQHQRHAHRGLLGRDGSTWTSVNGSTALKTGAGTRIGVMAAGDLGTTPRVGLGRLVPVTPDRTAGRSSRRTSSTVRRSTAAAGRSRCATTRTTESVADGHLKIETEPGDINGNNPIQPRNFVLQDAPEGDWVAETKFKAPLKHRYQLAGLLMYGNDDNYAKADIVAYNAPGSALDLRAELAAEKGGNGVAGGDAVNIPDTTESGYWWVQVTKVGTTYTAAVKSTAGASWTPIGDGITYDGPLNSLGLMAIGPEQEEPVTVEFDYFHLDTEEEPPADTTAPVTTATQAVVEDGVQVTLTATDETGGSGVASTEYRIDEGEWTAYTAPFTISEPGTYTVEFRSTDVAGNEEATASIEVVVEEEPPADTTAPVTTATQAAVEDGVQVTLTATDETGGSGVASTEYRIDEGEWTDYTAPFVISEPGTHTVEFRSTDVAGNEEAAKSLEVVVEAADEDAPSTTITWQPATADGAQGWYVTAPSFTLAAEDDGSVSRRPSTASTAVPGRRTSAGVQVARRRRTRSSTARPTRPATSRTSSPRR